MEKPNNYENTQASGEYVPFEPGPHFLTIKQVVETKSSTGKPMIKVFFDAAPADKQAGYFTDAFKADTRQDKKWPFGGTAYIVTEDSEGKCSRNFKGFTTSVEKSNPGFTVQWGPAFAECFKGKSVSANFRTEIGVYQSKETRHTKLAWFIPNDDVATAKVPDPVETKEYQEWRDEKADALEDSSTPFDDIDDDLPFA